MHNFRYGAFSLRGHFLFSRALSALGKLLASALIFALLYACGEDSAVADATRTFTLTLWNRTKKPLLEARVHGSTNFRGAENLLSESLPVEQAFPLADFLSGNHVTVIRRRVDVGDPVAFTTAVGLQVDAPGYTLVAFDSSFRLLTPQSSENWFAEGYQDGMAGQDGDPQTSDGGDPVSGDPAPGDPGAGDSARGDPAPGDL